MPAHQSEVLLPSLIPPLTPQKRHPQALYLSPIVSIKITHFVIGKNERKTVFRLASHDVHKAPPQVALYQ